MDKNTRDTMFSSKSDEWQTPPWLFKGLNDEVNFTLDPAATDENHLCEKYYTIEQDGLAQSWEGERVFINPPYSRRQLKRWVEKGYKESCKKDTLVVMLIPSRTDTRYWHDYVMNAAEIYFIEGRLKFSDHKNAAPFPSALVVFKGKQIDPPAIYSLCAKEMKKMVESENCKMVKWAPSICEV